MTSRQAIASSRVNRTPSLPSWMRRMLTEARGFAGSRLSSALTRPLSPAVPLTGAQLSSVVSSA